MYQAIYRRYRPKTFTQVIGQDDVTNILKNQVNQNKIGHAYIFTGTRGTGKTSCAKIMARAVNCLNPIDGNPCNECENCKAIINQSTMDVVEMDAASNRGIDDIRELRDQVIFPPASLKYKVYIIDEVHMLTKEGFNALLKIMEEPPSHLIFILATTEIEKIPQTILSRCQRFDFRRIQREDIAKSIRIITDDLGVKIDNDATALIARAADGALRDAQSLLDQVLAFSDGEITADIVSASIGSADEVYVFNLVDEIAKKDENSSIDLAKKIIEDSGSSELVNSLIQHYENLILAKVSPKNIQGVDEEKVQKLISQSQGFDLSELSDSIEILLEADRKLKFSSQTRAIGLMTIINLLRQVDRNMLISRIENLEKKLEQLLGSNFTQVKNISNNINAHISPKPNKIEENRKTENTSLNSQVTENLPKNQKSDIIDNNSSVNLGNGLNDLKIIEQWNIMVDEIISNKGFWGIWIKDLNIKSFENGVLSLEIDGSEKTKLNQARSNLKELTQIANQYFNSNFKILINEVYKEEENTEKNKKDLLKDMFGDKLEFN